MLKKGRIILLIVTVISFILFILLVNGGGAVGFLFLSEGYEEAGIALLLSVPLLLAALILVFCKKSILPAILDIAGTACFIYAIGFIGNIPTYDTTQRLVVEELSRRHHPSIVFTVLLLFMCAVNYILPENNIERRERKELKIGKTERKLSDEEKII
jgi:hypothetical protein